MDDIDIRILEELQKDGRRTLSDLSDVLSLSRPSVAERVRRLQEQGVIEAFTVRVPPTAVGRTITVILQISDLNVPCQKFEHAISEDADILECHRVTGAVSYIMKAAVSSMVHLELLVDRLIPYGRVNTSVVLSSPVSHRIITPPKINPAQE